VTAVGAGSADVAVAVGAEQLTSPDRLRTLAAIGTALDLEQDRAAADSATRERRSAFADIYADLALGYMARTGATREDLAWVVVKNRLYPPCLLARPPIVDAGNAPPAEPATRSRSCDTRSQRQSGVPIGQAPASVCNTGAKR
jgi:hypothetical protein